jgi:hypothetical protein
MRYVFSVFAVLALGAVWLLFGRPPAWNAPDPDAVPGTADLQAAPDMTEADPPVDQQMAQTPARRVIEDFHMFDLDSGWLRYEDGVVMVTTDGGFHWHEAGADGTMPGDPDSLDSITGDPATAASENEAFLAALQALEAAHLDFDLPPSISVEGRWITAKRVQPVSGRIGWALAEESGNSDKLLVSVDGGITWHEEVTADVRAALEEEKGRRERRAEEANLYASPQQVVKPGTSWTLLPDVTYPGDAILVRRGEPGELEWQGKMYPLQSYKAGYYTYLPIPRSLEPGTYSIGDEPLTVLEKTFKTQYLTVTEEMESMRRNTERIEADQKKVNEARSRSAPTFLFDSEFIEPLEGRLSTPYGYTRYINNELSSTHMAIDIAAPQGKEIVATNDGVVALADELYLSGLTIYIDHGMGLFSQYGHLSEFRVNAGDTVKKGDVIGLVGSTGFSTGPHLHFTFFAHNTPVNPDVFFGATPFRWMNP